MRRLRVLRIYHEGGDSTHRARDRALEQAGVDVTLVLPHTWPGQDGPTTDVSVVALSVCRPGDVNRHAYLDPSAMRELVMQCRPDVVDIHEEPFSLSARQWLRAAGGRPVVMYTAQNLDKRWPPPFAQYERAALRQVRGFYACSAQAASVLRGKGFDGALTILPLGVDTTVHAPGGQVLPANELILGLVGRLVPEKGVGDAIRVLATVHRATPTRLVVVGDGPAAGQARRLSHHLGVADRCTWLPWCSSQDLAALYRRMHVMLVPSRSTTRWVEQFGRVVTEGRANGAVPVAYACGSLPEVVGATGIVVAEGDHDAMAAAVLALTGSPMRWLTLRQAGLDLTPRHGWDRVARGQIELYEGALRAQPHPVRRPTAATRREAASQFGPPAMTVSGPRPFALPILREPGPASKLLARAVDLVTGQA